MNHSQIKNYGRKRAKVARKSKPNPVTMVSSFPQWPHCKCCRACLTAFEIQRFLFTQILQNNCKNNHQIFKVDAHFGWFRSDCCKPGGSTGLWAGILCLCQSRGDALQQYFKNICSFFKEISFYSRCATRAWAVGKRRVCRCKLMGKSAAFYSAHSLITPLFLPQTCSINMVFGV